MDSNSKPEKIEQDTAESEDAVPIWDLIMPTESVEKFNQFSISFNKGVFHGWVKQPSPCCAAASIAGAWNCLAKVKRDESAALSHMDILHIYISMFEDMLLRKKESFQRKLGVAVGVFFEWLFERMRELGCYLPGPKPRKITKRNLQKLLMSFAISFRSPTDNGAALPPSPSMGPGVEGALRMLAELFTAEEWQWYDEVRYVAMRVVNDVCGGGCRIRCLWRRRRRGGRCVEARTTTRTKTKKTSTTKK